MALHYILDGYNIIKCTDRLADCSLEEGRNGLLRILNHDRPQGSSRHCVMVVFDGKDDVWGQRPSGEVKVVFTSGLLIHIHPDNLGKAIDEICRVSKRFVWGFEYYSETEEHPYPEYKQWARRKCGG